MKEVKFLIAKQILNHGVRALLAGEHQIGHMIYMHARVPLES